MNFQQKMEAMIHRKKHRVATQRQPRQLNLPIVRQNLG
jgi:hypothetical protein